MSFSRQTTDLYYLCINYVQYCTVHRLARLPLPNVWVDSGFCFLVAVWSGLAAPPFRSFPSSPECRAVPSGGEGARAAGSVRVRFDSSGSWVCRVRTRRALRRGVASGAHITALAWIVPPAANFASLHFSLVSSPLIWSDPSSPVRSVGPVFFPPILNWTELNVLYCIAVYSSLSGLQQNCTCPPLVSSLLSACEQSTLTGNGPRTLLHV